MRYPSYEKPAQPRRRAGMLVRFDRRRRDPLGRRLVGLVAAARGVTEAQLLQRERGTAEIAFARQLAMYLMHVSLQRIYSDVGTFFGRDRTTVSHACAIIEDLRDDPQFEIELARLEAELSLEGEVAHAQAG